MPSSSVRARLRLDRTYNALMRAHARAVDKGTRRHTHRMASRKSGRRRRGVIYCQARGGGGGDVGDVGRVITGITWYQPICVVLRPRRPELHTLRAAAGTIPLSFPLPMTTWARGGQMIYHRELFG